MRKIGIITFSNSYNCGSMLETFAIYTRIKKIDENTEIINFSNEGQQSLYSVFNKSNSIKNIIKNILLFPHRKRIKINNEKYEEFGKKYFQVSGSKTKDINNIDEQQFYLVVAGSDQIWNITIADGDDAYFLNWVHHAKKIAYAPSFGSKNILKYSKNPDKYRNYLKNFDALSIREENGRKWIKDLVGVECPILVDPTLLFDSDTYDELLDHACTPNGEYIFFYCPSFDWSICKFVKQVSNAYHIPVICWSTKSYYTRCISLFGFKLPEYESPSVYLDLIKNAKLIFTTSFHGTVFSTIYKKIFYTIKNGGMYGDDDRVLTLLSQLGMKKQLIEPKFRKDYDYLQKVDYKSFGKNIIKLRSIANSYIDENIGRVNESTE